MSSYQCSLTNCSTQYQHKFNLVKHLKSKHNLFACSLCLETFKTDSDMKVHRIKTHKKCMICGKIILRDFKRHVSRCDKKPYKEFQLDDSVDIKHILLSKLEKLTLPIKWMLNRKVIFIKHSVDECGDIIEDAKSEPTSRCLMTLTTHKSEISEQLDKNIEKILESMDTYQKEGSGWQYSHTDHWLLKVYRYKPLAASSYIPTPSKLIGKRALINIRNRSDNKCFLWSILAFLHRPKNHANLVSSYLNYEHELDMTNIPYPVDIKNISRFEELNNKSVNVFGYSASKNIIYPVRISKLNNSTHINLLILTKGRVKHYCLITSLDRLLFKINNYCIKKYVCHYCLQPQYKQWRLNQHLQFCKTHDSQRTELSLEKTLSFKNYRFQLKIPYVIYSDFECFINENKHKPSGYCLVVVNDRSEIIKKVTYSYSNVMDNFFKDLFEIEREINELNDVYIELNMTEIDEVVFTNSSVCYICQERFNEKVKNYKKVRDHDHKTGRFRGAAHSICNLQYQTSNKIPVIFHGLKNYDAHLIVQELGKYMNNRQIEVIGKDTEKYITFSIDNLQFLDSYNFLSASLSKLVETLKTFRYVNEPLLQKKGIYPYEYMSSFDKFNEQLPPIDKFYSTLRGKGIKPDKYQQALNIWQHFNVQNMQQYHDLYLETDTLLLAEVFETFRELSLRDYGIDPCHVFSLPGLTWQAALKFTNEKIDLIRNSTMHLYILEAIRACVSMISTKYSKANNKYISDYDLTKDSKE